MSERERKRDDDDEKEKECSRSLPVPFSLYYCSLAFLVLSLITTLLHCSTFHCVSYCSCIASLPASVGGLCYWYTFLQSVSASSLLYTFSLSFPGYLISVALIAFNQRTHAAAVHEPRGMTSKLWRLLLQVPCCLTRTHTLDALTHASLSLSLSLNRDCIDPL